MPAAMLTLVIPEHDPYESDAPYPGDIKPGTYTLQEVVDLLRQHKNNPDAVQFLADMLEP
jgi:hypothetical protein